MSRPPDPPPPRPSGYNPVQEANRVSTDKLTEAYRFCGTGSHFENCLRCRQPHSEGHRQEFLKCESRCWLCKKRAHVGKPCPRMWLEYNNFFTADFFKVHAGVRRAPYEKDFVELIERAGGRKSHEDSRHRHRSYRDDDRRDRSGYGRQSSEDYRHSSRHPYGIGRSRSPRRGSRDDHYRSRDQSYGRGRYSRSPRHDLRVSGQSRRYSRSPRRDSRVSGRSRYSRSPRRDPRVSGHGSRYSHGRSRTPSRTRRDDGCRSFGKGHNLSPQRASKKAERLCFTCGQAGHIQKNCAGRRRAEDERCGKCQGSGHKTADCHTKEPRSVECFVCHEPGHKAVNCPYAETVQQALRERREARFKVEAGVKAEPDVAHEELALVQRERRWRPSTSSAGEGEGTGGQGRADTYVPVKVESLEDWRAG